MAGTKVCDACDKEIGESETTCPACKADLAELDETTNAVERALSVIEKRKKRATPPPEPNPQPAQKLTGAARLRALGRAIKKGS
jgi:hypothetical protein